MQKHLSGSHRIDEARSKSGAAILRWLALLVFFALLAFAVVRIRSGSRLRIDARSDSRSKGHDFERRITPGFSCLFARSGVGPGFDSARQRIAGSVGHRQV